MTTKELGFSDKLANAVAFAQEVKAIQVTSAAEHKAASEKIAAVREMEKELEAEYKALPVIIQAKEIQKVKGELADLLETARKTAKSRQMAWEDAEEMKRRAEEARQAAEAKKKADEEALARAAEAQAAGDKDKAIEVLDEAVRAPAPVVVIPKTAPKTANRRMIPKFRIVNESLIPRHFMSPDGVKIGGVIRSLKAAANIPGVEFYEEAA